MADVRPFICCRPTQNLASEVAALPYDVFSRKEAAQEIANHPHSFLRIDKSCATLPSEVNEYDPQVYQKAAQLMAEDLKNGIFEDEPQPHYFLYRLNQDHHSQTGIVCCIALQDLKNGVLKRHENTRELKLKDRIQHIQALNAQTGPVFVTYPAHPQLDTTVKQACAQTQPLYDFTTPDNITHTIWRIDDKNAEETISNSFKTMDALYIADGHHRAAAAEQVSIQGGEASYLLMIAFPSNQVRILDYNRVVFDTNGLQPEALLERISQSFGVNKVGDTPRKPQQKGEFALYLDGQWYQLIVHEELRPSDAVEGLDVSLLHNLILEPILGIDNPRSNKRIAYVGGSRGLSELKTQADARGAAISFALYPCCLEELFAVADEGRLMPPKSTWFDPKPRSGLFIHRL